MRLSVLFLRLTVFAAAGFGAVMAAQATVTEVENRSVIAVRETLVDKGYEWASVLGDGLQVILEGEAPTEAARFRVISAAGGMVDASRVIDNMSVADSEELAPPDFAIEILRNDSGISIIGLIPTVTDREALVAQITNIADDLPVTDLLEVADYPVPDNWEEAVSYGVRALDLLPRSKISINARRVDVNAISNSPEEKARIERQLNRNIPDSVRRAINITAPRPVISPFTTRFTLDENGARFYACAINDQAAQLAILQAAANAGFTGQTNCVEGLGAPARTWGDAVAQGIEAVGKLGGGTVTIADTDVTLVGIVGTEEDLFNDIVGELENSLPDAFALSYELPQPPEATPNGPPQFTATLSPEGSVQLRGRIPDEVTNIAAQNYALAKFGRDQITMRTRIVEGLPSGWSVRVLAGIEALSNLSNGAVIVEPNMVKISGNTGDQNASDAISRLLIEKLGQTADFEIDVTYVKQLDPIAGLPTPEECVEQIMIVTDARKITFEPSSAELTADTQPVVDDIAEILKRCGDLRIRIAGYTDSQGREIMNQELSQERAGAVLTALRSRRVPVGTFEAIGFGEADPIADNDTDAGREANRRIEFSLIVPEPIAEEPTTLEEIEAPIEDVAPEQTQSDAAPAEETPAETPTDDE